MPLRKLFSAISVAAVLSVLSVSQQGSREMEALTYLNADDPMPYRTLSPHNGTPLSFAGPNRLFRGQPCYSGVRSGGVHQRDSSLLNDTNLSGRVHLQIRADAFNGFNHPEFTPPNTSVTSSAFETVKLIFES